MFGDVFEEMQWMFKLMVNEFWLLKLLEKRVIGQKGEGVDDGIGLMIIKVKQMGQLIRLVGLGFVVVDFIGVGIINLEGQRLERLSKMRLVVGDEEVRLVFRDDFEIKGVGVMF